MTQYMIYALVAYMIGVLIERFVNDQFGDVLKVVAAVVFVLAWLTGVLRG